MSSWIVSNFWLIPAVPLAVSLVVLSLANPQRSIAALLAIFGQVVAFVLAIMAFLATLQMPGFRAVHNFIWFTFGDQALRIGWMLDPLAAAMMVMITLVGLCIFVFSVGYMAGDKNFTRFFSYLSFFSGAMLGAVIANSLLLLFVSWELVGLASYLLIGFWIERPSAAAAAKKAFITTRIGDLGFFLGMLWLYHNSGTLLFYDRGRGCLEDGGLLTIGASATFIALLIFCGAVGKSGQFPLHVWLPDAMEGPTPVSALIHAATMVAAGVFLVARVYPLFSLGAVNGVTPSLTVVVTVGVVTALMASLIALAQFDIKRILAYSTVSQLGLMMVSLGVGGVAAGIMHLIAHGFFKALLFLGAGSVIHGLDHEQDIRKMGGLRWIMPVTFLTYAIGMVNLSGVPFFFSGGWTKEEILHSTAHWSVSPLPHYLMLAGVILTALYMTRQLIYVFCGSARKTEFQSARPAEFHSAEGARTTENISVGRTGQGPVFHAHESPRVMTMPLIVLALCSILFVLVLTPAWPWLHAYLNGEPARADLSLLIQPILFLSLALVAGGIGVGWLIYRNASEVDPLARAQPGVFRFLENKMWFDEIYERTIIALSRMLSRLADWLDRYFWDGLVRLFAGLAQAFGVLSKGFDDHGINAGVDETTAGTRGFGRLIAAAHSGQIQAYLGAIAIGMLLLLVLYAWLG
ncbi:MAG: NADH-quinone oxidoreductase subunit L [Verrucomicrobia bacterium]|nr:MAG: NADH-quinone oxidoreductase subunit L [Verrucomicrobiota bacterium]